MMLSSCMRGRTIVVRTKAAQFYNASSSLSTLSSSSSNHNNNNEKVTSTVKKVIANNNKNKNSNGGGSGGISMPKALGLAGLSLATGYTAGIVNKKEQPPKDNEPPRALPNGLPRACCSCEESHDNHDKDCKDHNVQLSELQKELPSKLQSIVGTENVLSGLEENSSNTIYLKGARLGRGGKALAIVTPTSLKQAVDALQAVVDANCVVIPQGANTGLTGGSVPRPEDNEEERPSVVINMRKLDTMFPIDNGTKVVCLAGAGIASLAQALPVWGFPNRESHSILGSTFLDPTCAAGVAFGSGGTQLRKGPAYTDRALYCKVHRDKWGKNIVQVVNTLGVETIEDSDFPYNSGSPVDHLDAYANDVKNGYTRSMAKSSDSQFGKAMASDRKYAEAVCNCHDGDKGSDQVSRANADTKGEDCNRSEGKVLILATVHDTFEKAKESKTFFVSFDDLETALAFRKEVCLNNPKDLPISVEYMDRDSVDICDRSGRILGNLIKVVGMGSFIGLLWNVKLKIEALPFDGADLICDKLLHTFNNVMPAILPKRMMEAGKLMDHHIAMTIGDFGDSELKRCLERMTDFQEKYKGKMIVNECEGSSDVMSVNAFRFVAATSFRTWCVGENVQGISVDYALPKKDGEAPELYDSTADVSEQYKPVKRMRYSHFGCNVVHEDLAYPLGVDTHAAKYALKKQVEKASKGKLPAEHGHGMEYAAPKETQARWKKMDPLNVMNPGIGGLSKKFRYGS